MEYRGTISASTAFDYFPYQVDERRQRACWGEILEEIRPDCELWRVICELDRLQAPAEVLLPAVLYVKLRGAHKGDAGNPLFA